jgi:molecular chaperone DnaK (HSP70)
MVLYKMKQLAETELTDKVTEVGVIVPVDFFHSQHQATNISGVTSRLIVFRIINE